VRPLPGASSLRCGAAKRRTRSALVVSHHLDGLLRTQARGFVAPRCRSGVRRVSGLPEPVPSEDGSGPPGTLPATRLVPLEEFPSSTAGTASLRPVALLTLPALSHRPPQPKLQRPCRSRRTGGRGASEEARWHRPTSRYGEAPIRRSGPPRHRRTLSHRRTGHYASADHRPAPPRWLQTDGRVPSGHGVPPCTAESGCAPAPESAGTSRPATEAAGTPRSARITEVTRADLRDGASGRLQGLAPPTSPLCRAAVASRPTPDPSMGFCPLQGPLTFRTSPRLPARVSACDRGR
jgi:hypothetical protein